MKLTKKNYFSKKASMEYMSVSQFKAFEKCQSAALAELQGKYEREKTTALLVGSYIDSYFEGPKHFEKFLAENYTAIYTQKGTLRAEFVQADEIIARMKKDKLFMEYIKGKSQVIMAGTIEGVAVKIKIDSLHKDKIVDMKVMKDFQNVFVSERGSLPWFDAWGYDLQGAVYQEIVRQNTGERLPFYLAAATKEKITDLDIVHIGQNHLDIALDHFRQYAPLYDAIKQGIIEPERCENCEWCKKTKVLTEPKEADEFYLI